MNNLGFSVKAIRKASTHLTEEPVFKLSLSKLFPALPSFGGAGGRFLGQFLIPNHSLSDCRSVATL